MTLLRAICAVAALCLAPISAFAQSTPEQIVGPTLWGAGISPTQGTWDSVLGAKQDTILFGTGVKAAISVPVNAAGGLATVPLSGLALASDFVSQNLGYVPVNPANNGSEFTPSLFRATIGLGALATLSSVDLGTTQVLGLLPASKLATGAAVTNLGYVPVNPANNGTDFTSPSTVVINLSAIPHAANTTAVANWPRVTGAMVLRDGYTTAGDTGAPTLYYWSSSACTLNGNTGDNGYEIKPPVGNSGCWTAAFPTSGADIRNWGVVASTSPGSDATGANTAEFYAAAKAASLRGAAGATLLVPPLSFELGQTSDIDLTAYPNIRILGGGATVVGYQTANWYADYTIRMNGGNDPAIPKYKFRPGANTEIAGIRLVNSALPYDVPTTSRQGFDIVKHFSGTGFYNNRSDINIHDVQINGFTMAIYSTETTGSGGQQLQRNTLDHIAADATSVFDINGCGDKCEQTRIEGAGYLTPFQGVHPLSGVTYDITGVADSGSGYAVTGSVVSGAPTIALSGVGATFLGPNQLSLPSGASIALGQTVSGADVPANTTVAAVDTVNLIVTMSANATGTNAAEALVFGAHEVTATSSTQSTPFVVGDVVGVYGIGPKGSGQPLGRYTIDSLGPGSTDFTLAGTTYAGPMTGPTTVTGTVTDNSLSVTGLANTVGVYPGQHVAGTGIPGSTQVQTVGATSFTLTGTASVSGGGSITSTLTLGGRVNIPMQRRIGGTAFAWHGHGTQGGEYAASLWEYGHDVCINYGTTHGPMTVFYPWCDGYDTDGSSADATSIGLLQNGLGGAVHGGAFTDKGRQFVVNTTDGPLYGGNDRLLSVVDTAVGVGAGCSANINGGIGTAGAFATLISGSLAAINVTVRGYSSCQQPVVMMGTLTNTSTHVTGLPTTNNFFVGMPVSGTNVPANATVASIVSATEVTLSAAETGGGSQSLTFGTLYNGVYVASGAGSFFASNVNTTRVDDQIGLYFQTATDCLKSQINGVSKNCTPPTSTYTCNTGWEAQDAAYIYFCISQNTWKRAALSTF